MGGVYSETVLEELAEKLPDTAAGRAAVAGSAVSVLIDWPAVVFLECATLEKGLTDSTLF